MTFNFVYFTFHKTKHVKNNTQLIHTPYPHNNSNNSMSFHMTACLLCFEQNYLIYTSYMNYNTLCELLKTFSLLFDGICVVYVYCVHKMYQPGCDPLISLVKLPSPCVLLNRIIGVSCCEHCIDG